MAKKTKGAPTPDAPGEAEPNFEKIAEAVWASLAPDAPLAIPLSVRLSSALVNVGKNAALAAALLDKAPAWATNGRPRAYTFKQPFIFQDIVAGGDGPVPFFQIRVLCEDTRSFDGMASTRAEAVGAALGLAREAGAI